MDASQLKATETVSASRKLGREDAIAMLEQANRLLVAKGKKLSEWKISGEPPEDAVEAMLGPTGNLRAPTMRVGKTLVVGFEDSMFERVFG